jgi:hypothetical protein
VQAPRCGGGLSTDSWLIEKKLYNFIKATMRKYFSGGRLAFDMDLVGTSALVAKEV